MFDNQNQGSRRVSPADAFADQMQPDYHRALNLIFGQRSVMDDLAEDQIAPPRSVAFLPEKIEPQSFAFALPDTKKVGIVEKGVRGAIGNLGKSGTGLIQAGAEALDLGLIADIAASAGRRARNISEGAVLDNKPIAGFARHSLVQDLPGAAASAITSIGTNLPALAANVLLPGSGLPMKGAQSFGIEYSDGRAAGFTPMAAAVRGVPMVLADVVGESVGNRLVGNTLSKSIRGAIDEGSIIPLARSMVRSGVIENPGEQLTTALKFGIDKMPGFGMNQDATLQDYLKAVKDTGLATMLRSGGKVAGESAVHDQMPDPNNMGKRMVFGAFAGNPPR